MADLYFDADDAGTNWGAASDLVAPQPSGSTWDVFGTVGDLFDSAAEAVGGWYELASAKDLAEIERDTLREQAKLSSFDQIDGSFGSGFQTTSTGSGQINYPMWSLIFAAIGLLLTGYAITRKR